VDDQEWFPAFPDRRLRMREATTEEAGPARPGTRMLAIVARGARRKAARVLIGQDEGRIYYRF
jgi:hypothetical protein